MLGKRKILLGALFAVAWAGIWPGLRQARGEVYISDSFYDWDKGADRSSGVSSPLSPQTYRDQDDDTGPGAKAQGDEDREELPAGVPSVTQVTLKEQYHEDYKVYEESMEDRFFFYTNVANGGITDKSVILDIPQNMFVTMEKDGALIDYTPGAAISGCGTYVARLTAIEDTSLPFSRQREYRAIFRFRIQEKPQEEAGEGQSKGLGLGYQVDWESYADGQWPGGEGSGISGMGSLGFGTGQGGGESRGGQDGNGLGSGGQDKTGPEVDESGGQDKIGPEVDESGGQDENSPGNGGGQGENSPEADGQDGGGGENGQAPEGARGSGFMQGKDMYAARTQVYNSATGKYEVTFENGQILTANIPEGFTGPGAVEILVSGGESTALYRNDAPVEYIPGNSITEPGYYRLDVDGQMWSFVIASSIKELDRYLAPAGMEITQASFDGETVEVLCPRYLPMEADGQYQITLTGKEGQGVQAVLIKDTLPPDIRVTVKGGRADIEYLSQDIALITLEKDGQIQEGFGGYVVSEPGSYKLSVTDGAGNVSSRQFTLKYQVNVYGIAAVALVIMLIIGGAVFVIHVKRTVKVR